MAKCVGPLHSSEARGKMGGLTYSSWRGSATVKAKHAPAQPRSILQLAVRSIAIYCARLWQTIAYQAEWNAYAATHPLSDWTNSPKRLTGMNWFLMLSTRLLRAGIAVVNTPPIVPAPDPVFGLTATGGVGSLVVDWDAPVGGTDRIELWLDGPHSPGRLGSLVRARYNVLAYGTDAPKTISSLQPGAYHVFARAFSADDGQVSTYVAATDVVT